MTNTYNVLINPYQISEISNRQIKLELETDKKNENLEVILNLCDLSMNAIHDLLQR